jgi:uncharacterized protein (TIGR03089 family)
VTAHTPADLLAAALAGDSARPLLTYYDDRTEERAELSVATAANWVAKTANLLTVGLGLAAGRGRVAVLAPVHWQTATVLLGAWSAGCAVDLHTTVGSDVTVAAADRLGEVADDEQVLALSLTGLGTPVADLPAGIDDFALEVRGHADSYLPGRLDPASPGLLGNRPCSLGELVVQARRRAAELGLEPGARLLVTDRAGLDPVDWLLAPLLVGGSVVLVRHPAAERLDRHLREERARPLAARP